VIGARVVLAAAVVALAAPARALDWSGFADVGYVQNDAWSGALHDRQPTWDYGGQLSLSAAPLRPGLLTVTASGNYRQLRSQYFQSSARSDNYGYSLGASVAAEKPLSISLAASRGWSDFTSSAATTSTGATLSSTQSATASYNVARMPGLRAKVSRTEFENRAFAAPATTGSSTSLTLGANQTLDRQSYSLSYDTSWNDGSYAETNYRSHFFDLLASSSISDRAELRLSERYFLRSPTVVADTNPRLDDNAFGAQLSWRPTDRATAHASYLYRHLVVDLPTAEDRESLSHGLSVGAERRLGREWTLTGNVGGSYGSDTIAARRIEIAGEQAGLGARWQRSAGRSTLYGTLSGDLGGQQQNGDSHLAYGAGASAGATRTWGTFTSGISYGGGYQSNLGTNLGWTVHHQLTAQLEGRTFLGGRMRDSLTASQTRRGHPILGDSGSQSLTLSLANSWRRHDLALTAGISDAASSVIGSPLGSDLALPSRLNTQSRFLTLTASTMRWGASWSAIARHLETTSPGRPTQSEDGVGAAMSYQLGAFVFTAEDRYSIGGSGGAKQHGNLVMARLARSFGGRF
jgi:hypothetical protein